MRTTTPRGGGIAALLGWALLAVGLWVFALPLAWALLRGLGLLLPGGPEASLAEAATAYGRLAWLQLLTALPALVLASRLTTAFRAAAVGLALAIGTLLGVLLVVGFGDPVLQAVVSAWVLWGAIVPRPPGARRPAAADDHAARHGQATASPGEPGRETD